MIVYFSSTGNSLSIAKQLGQMLNEQVINIKEASAQNENSDKIIGLVYPVHNYDMPNLVQRWVQNFPFPEDAYVFGIANHGGDIGNALYTLKHLLQRRAMKLSYTNDLLMPVNSRIMYGMTTDKIKERTQAAVPLVKQFGQEILARKSNTEKLKEKKRFTLATKLTNTPFIQSYFHPHVDESKCVNCGICASVCPVDNISKTQTHAVIGNRCEKCMACAHWCPKQAIKVGKRSIRKEQQYRHPKVKTL